MQRRKFLLVSLVATAGSALPLGSCQTRHPELEKLLDHPTSLAQIFDEKTILGLGKSYLEKAPGEASVGKLVDLLLLQADGRSFSTTADNGKTLSFLQEKTKEDFRAGNTVILSGWVLSATEARQSALLYLNKTQ